MDRPAHAPGPDPAPAAVPARAGRASCSAARPRVCMASLPVPVLREGVCWPAPPKLAAGWAELEDGA
eukprot:7361416-Lingulodinium_polyedra.AAC.1